MHSNIDINKTFNKAFTAVETLKSNIDSANLTNEEIDRLLDSALKAELQAYKTKIGLELHVLSRLYPNMTSRDILMKMLALLPADVPKNFLPVLTEYVVGEWNGLRRKMAA